MASSSWEQVKKICEDRTYVAILLSSEVTIDALAASLAFSRYLKTLGKKCDIICEKIDFPDNYAFLPGIESIKSELTFSDRFRIKVDMSRHKVKEFTYDVSGDFLNIYLTPENGMFSMQNVTMQHADYAYDLIVTFGVTSLSSLGVFFQEQSQFFYEIPIVNIDHALENDHYGLINKVDLAATSLTEMLYDFFEESAPKLFDQDFSTLLLAGLIGQTRSFKKDHVTPNSLQAASTLLAKGARREDIIHNLYRKKSVEILKVWGVILSRLSFNEDHNIASSYLQLVDLTEGLKIRSSDILDLLYDLLITMPSAQVIVISYQLSSSVSRHCVWADKNHSTIDLVKKYNPRGTQEMAFIDDSLSDVIQSQKGILEEIARVIGYSLTKK